MDELVADAPLTVVGATSCPEVTPGRPAQTATLAPAVPL
jgi:hypothetical protein